MKAKLIICGLLILFTAGMLRAQRPENARSHRSEKNIIYHQPNVDERNYQDSTGSYVIRFTFGMFEPYTPVGGEEDDVRYSAFIEVFKVDDGVQSLVGHGFMGTYSPEGCIYDEADYLIREARKIELRAERD